jgi:hypothetical protein
MAQLIYLDNRRGLNRPVIIGCSTREDVRHVHFWVTLALKRHREGNAAEAVLAVQALARTVKERKLLPIFHPGRA